MAAPSTKPLSRSSRALLCLLSGIVFLASAEAVCRVYFGARIGPSVLFYGTAFERNEITPNEQTPLLRNLRRRRLSGVGDRNNSVRYPDNELSGYTKYYPHQPRSTYNTDTGEVYPVTINARGFRGREFTEDKASGVIRVVTLGASSTFGYHDRDDSTYPAQLERLLNDACPNRSFEAINLGIPHLTSTQILALFVAEGVRLHPDLVTFYEGFNDSNSIGAKPEPTASASAKPSARPLRIRVSRWMREHFLVVALADALIAQWTKRYSPEQIEAHVEATRKKFLENLSALLQFTRQNGAGLLLASQQARSLLIPREEIRGVTFQQELDIASALLAQQGWLDRKAAAFFTQGALMQAEAEWAHQHAVPFVDVLSALDTRRDTVVSWVHLNHEGNHIVAEQLAPPILKRFCPASVTEARNGGS